MRHKQLYLLSKIGILLLFFISGCQWELQAIENNSNVRPPLPIETVIIQNNDNGFNDIYIFDVFSGYKSIDLDNGELNTIQYSGLPNGISIDHLEFANYKNSIAFITHGLPAKIWLADINFENAKMIYEDKANLINDNTLINFIWTPNDSQLIIDILDSLDDMIYDLGSGKLEPWDYTCNTLAPSPRTEKIALWCSSNQAPESFAVIDWEEGIWKSETRPEEIVISNPGDFGLLFSYPVWRWSPDGEKVAFYDPLDIDGNLIIAEARGTQSKILPNSAFWKSDYFQKFPLQDNPIEWSQDGGRLLVFSPGDENNYCPSKIIEDGPLSGNYENIPCWTVIDVETGKIIWHISDLRELLPSYEEYDFYQAAISPDGNKLSIYFNNHGIHALWVLDINTNHLIWKSRVIATNMRWQNPNEHK